LLAWRRERNGLVRKKKKKRKERRKTQQRRSIKIYIIHVGGLGEEEKKKTQA